MRVYDNVFFSNFDTYVNKSFGFMQQREVAPLLGHDFGNGNHMSNDIYFIVEHCQQLR